MDKTWVLHDSHSLDYRSPFGAVPCNKGVTIKIETEIPITGVKLIINNENGDSSHYPMELEEKGTRVSYLKEIITPEKPGLIWYYFELLMEEGVYFYGNNQEGLGGVGNCQDSPPRAYQITVYNQASIVPQWFKEGVMYQIFVDRFYNGHPQGKVLNPKAQSLIHGDWNDTPFYIREKEGMGIKRWNFFGGNLLGVIKKLDYLESLGIKIIYFNPIFKASSNHKYDTADYKEIDPMFGNERIFKKLCMKAREKGIAIILDGVFSHTGSDSIYFNIKEHYPQLGAYQSKASPYYSWYKFQEHPQKYESWWGIGTLPNVNELDPSYQDFMIYAQDSVIKHWMEMGVKGWRLDVADELPEEFINKLRQKCKEIDNHSILLGEVWEDASNKISYGEQRQYLLGESLDSVTNYPFREILLDFILGNNDSLQTHQGLMSLYENYPKEYFYSATNLIGSHDVPRILTILGHGEKSSSLSEEKKETKTLSKEEKELGIKRLKLMSLVQMTFPGVPCIYYGDEAGLEGWEDPYNRGTFPWAQENKEILEWYRALIKIRNEHEVFTKGDWHSLSLEKDIYGFTRNTRDQCCLMIINRDEKKEITIQVDIKTWSQERIVDLLNHQEEIVANNEHFQITLSPLQGKILLGK